jgi:hemerythrin-like metal-binding protein
MMWQGRLPDWIYRPLPYLYLGFGTLALILANNILAVWSGIALLTAGVLVWVMRFQYRRHRERTWYYATPKEAAGGPSQESSMEICWRRTFETGHAVLDRQHRELFALGNDLVNGVLNDDPAQEIEALFNEVVDHVREHFDTEENVLSAMKHPLAGSHTEIHRALLTRVDEVSAQFKGGRMPSRELANLILFDLIHDHLVKEDSAFFEALSAKVLRKKAT